MVKNVSIQALEWLTDSTPIIAHLIFAVGEDEWVFEKILHRLKTLLEISSDEYGTQSIHLEETNPEEITNAIHTDSFFNVGNRIVFLRGLPSGKQSKVKEILKESLNHLSDASLYFIWLINEFDPYKKPRIYPYTEITPEVIIRFDERSDEMMLKWTKYIANELKLVMSPKMMNQIAMSAKYPYEINSYLTQISVWASQDGYVDDNVITKLALGEIESATEEVAFYLLLGNQKKMMETLYRLDQQHLQKNVTSMVWQLSAILFEVWYMITKTETSEKRWTPFYRILNDLEKSKQKITENAIWSTLKDLAELDLSLKSTGSYQQGTRLLVQTLIPAVSRFQAGTK
ncbi:MAG: hypothetical protein N2450_00095 [bacterium]|nr:hypothetical protein [bacterium]